jgi:DNA-binding NtrC family response regulator
VKSNWKILVVDDEGVMRESLAAWLAEDGYSVDTSSSGLSAIAKASETDYAIYFIDLKMPGGFDGIKTMLEVRRMRPDASVIIMTAYATVDTAITALKEGAQEYIVKPCNPEEISMLVARLIKVKALQRENRLLRKRLAKRYGLDDLVSRSPRMQEIFSLVREIADLRSTVLIQGESGTGKELIARAIHNSGSRAKRPFVAVSCVALAETLLESELFGYEKGAFTGAGERKKGKFELANGGTLFLDEIGDISSKLQLDLLRVLQERNFFRVGGNEEVNVDVRVIAATKVDLLDAVQAGTFRDDLFYRLNVINICIPPLRERREDVPVLARHLIERISSELDRPARDISEGALALLLEHEWPGNVRELENAVERAVVTCKSRLLDEPDFAFLAREARPNGWVAPSHLTLAEVERQMIVVTLQRTEGNIKEAAAILGIDRSTLYDKLKRYQIPR